MSKQPPPVPTASAVGPCPTVSQIVGRPSTGSLPSTIAPPDHPHKIKKSVKFQGDTLNFCDFIQVFVFTTNHHLKCIHIPSGVYKIDGLSGTSNTTEVLLGSSTFIVSDQANLEEMSHLKVC